VNPQHVFSLVGLAFILATPAAADPVGLFPTGIGSDGTLLREGSIDPHYFVLSGPVTGATTVAVSDGSRFVLRNAPCGGCTNPSGARIEFTAPRPVPEPATLLVVGTWASSLLARVRRSHERFCSSWLK
jgi:hypothetical protein